MELNRNFSIQDDVDIAKAITELETQTGREMTTDELKQAILTGRNYIEHNQVVNYGYGTEVNLPSYIYAKRNKQDEITGYKVSTPNLAEHIRATTHYFFTKDTSKGTVTRYFYMDGFYKMISDDMLKGLIKRFITEFDLSILKMSDVNEVFNDLCTDIVFVDSDTLNNDENIINFSNGILNINTLELTPHDPKHLCTIQIPCEWSTVPQPTPVYDKFIYKLCNGDTETKSLLQQYMGVTVSNIKGWRMKKALFMVGKGNTGKSQLKTLTEMLIGKGNYTGIDLKELEARFGTSNLYNNRLAGSSDMGYMTIDELKTFKKCTGGDSLFSEYKGENGFEFVYNGLLWFCMNELPKFGGDRGEWVYERIMVVECNNVIPKSDRDKFLVDKMYNERAGIIQKIVKSLKSVMDNGYEFILPNTSKTVLEDYKQDNSSVLTFYNECCQARKYEGKFDNCTTKRLFRIYQEYCKENNKGYSETERVFRKELVNLLGATSFDEITTRRSDNKYYTNITLTKHAKADYARLYGNDHAS